MKKLLILFCILAFCLVFVSCSTVNVGTGQGKYAFLMPDKGGIVKEVRTKMNFYILWGLVPLGDNSTDSMIGPKEKVVVKTYFGIVNFLLSIITDFVTITSNTVEVDVIK